MVGLSSVHLVVSTGATHPGRTHVHVHCQEIMLSYMYMSERISAPHSVLIDINVQHVSSIV